MLIQQTTKFDEWEKQRKDFKIQIESAFLQRIVEVPFSVEIDPSKMAKLKDPIYEKNKKVICQFLTLL